MPKVLTPLSGSTVAALYVVSTKTADYTLVADDLSAYIRMNKGSAGTLFVPAGLPVGWNVKVFNMSTFDITIAPVAASGVTFRPSNMLRLPSNKGVELIAQTGSVFDLVGGIAA